MPTIDDILDLLVPGEPKVYTAGGKEYRSVTSVIDAAGFGPDFSKVPPEVMRLAQERGRVVHKACEYIDKGTLDFDSVDPMVMGYVDAYVRFLRECHFRPYAIEEPMISETWNIGGTPDVIGFLNGQRAIVDRKTCDPDSVAARLQTGGYCLLRFDVHKEICDKRFGLKLNRNGTYKLVEHTGSTDEHCFQDLLEYVEAKARRGDWMRHYYLKPMEDKNNGTGTDQKA